MKFQSQKINLVSGSIGRLAGAMGSGGTHFRKKIQPYKKPIDKNKKINSYVSLANITWQGMAIEVKEQWGEYGSTLTHANNTHHKIVKSGWNAFLSSFIVLKQANLPTVLLTTSPPSVKGYLKYPKVKLNYYNARWWIVNFRMGIMRFSIYLSPKYRNTINHNDKDFYFYVNKEFFYLEQYPLPINFRSGRYFIKLKTVELDGGTSNNIIKMEDVI